VSVTEDQLMGRIDDLSEVLWSTGLSGSSMQALAEERLGYALPPPASDYAARNEWVHARDAVWSELLRVVRELRVQFRWSPTKLKNNRFLLSHSEVAQLYAQASVPTPESVAERWTILRLIDDVEKQLTALVSHDRGEEAQGLARTARTFLKKFLDASVPAEMPEASKRKTGGRPPEFVHEEANLWVEARRLVAARIRKLSVPAKPVPYSHRASVL
jgi:hypothetical protein